jgi:hypothetical protein
LFFLFIRSFVDKAAGLIVIVWQDTDPESRIPMFQELEIGVIDLKCNPGFFEPVADGIALALIVACPYLAEIFIG